MHDGRLLNGLVFLVAFLGSGSRCLLADDSYYDIPLPELKTPTGDSLTSQVEESGVMPYSPITRALGPRAELDGPGEVYIGLEDDRQFTTDMGGSTWAKWCRIFIRAPQGKDVTGRLFLAKKDASGMNEYKFKLSADAAKDDARKKFSDAKMAHYVQMTQRPIAGQAWFRYQRDKTEKALKELEPDRQIWTPPGNVFEDREKVYDVFSGGMAVAENLQLDRNLRGAIRDQKPTIDIASLQGISTNQIDWKPLLKDAKPQFDPLSKLIPADQHVLFFPSFEAMAKLADQANGREALTLKIAEPQSDDLEIVDRYERQLGIGLSTLGRIIGPAAIKSVAITGSDPYFPTGTDVAVLFEADHPDVLSSLVKAQIAASVAKHSQVEPKSGQIGNVRYEGFVSPDRKISTYVAKLDGAVVVTNSLAQLKRLTMVGTEIDPLASLDEYKFFRRRYPLGESGETALLILSDATIRRWCSPRWRIASARRTFAAAAMTDLTSQNIEDAVAARTFDQPLQTDLASVDVGQLTLKNGVVSSSTLGSLAFMTPIIELPIEKVTQAESDAYGGWRLGYEQNWRWAFDPIALRIGVSGEKLAADLTVMPLIAGSDYNEFVGIARGAKIPPDAGDRHNALIHGVLAVNPDSDRVRSIGNWLSNWSANGAKIDPLSWLGSSVALYIDDDPIWEKLAGMSPGDREIAERQSLTKLPVALVVDVRDPLKLSIFLAGLRAYVEETAPRMVVWESLSYRDQPYVRVKSSAAARDMMGEERNLTIYYAPAPERLIVSLNEAVLKHALDRQIVRNDAGKKKVAQKPDEGGSLPWLGTSLCLQVDRRMFDIFDNTGPGIMGPLSNSGATMQLRSWTNIPILNEWKRMFPNEDPVKVHERLWHTRLVCPGGGEYVWNDEWKTIESTVYGHPGQPKSGPKVSSLMGQFERANLGITFEGQGLRGRAELIRAPKPAKAGK